MAHGVGSDEEALAASLADPVVFAVLFERHVDTIYRYLSLRVGRDLAEDLTADTFARALAGRRRYQADRGAVKPQLYGIATNLVREHRRDEQRHIRAISLMYEATFRSTDDAVQLVERLRLASALTSLKAEWRSVVLMIGVGGLSYEDAAAALHIPVGTVRSRYSRTRTQLIANLADTAGHKGTGDKVS